MAGRKRQPAPQSNKDESGVIISAPPVSPVATEPAAGRQPQRPGQDARFQEKPGVRDDEKMASAAPDRVSPPLVEPPSTSSITKKR